MQREVVGGETTLEGVVELRPQPSLFTHLKACSNFRQRQVTHISWMPSKVFIWIRPWSSQANPARKSTMWQIGRTVLESSRIHSQFRNSWVHVVEPFSTHFLSCSPCSPCSIPSAPHDLVGRITLVMELVKSRCSPSDHSQSHSCHSCHTWGTKPGSTINTLRGSHPSVRPSCKIRAFHDIFMQHMLLKMSLGYILIHWDAAFGPGSSKRHHAQSAFSSSCWLSKLKQAEKKAGTTRQQHRLPSSTIRTDRNQNETFFHCWLILHPAEGWAASMMNTRAPAAALSSCSLLPTTWACKHLPIHHN